VIVCGGKFAIFLRSIKMSKREIWKYSVVSCLVFCLYGCGRPNFISTDAAVYSGGKLYAVSSKDMNSVYEATLKAFDQLEVEIVENAKDVFYAKVTGKVADGGTITVRLEPGENNITNLSIKASKFISGNEERARVVYEKIKENL
jgi:outer membrane protein assembly factor BamB